METFNTVGISVVPRSGADLKPHCREVLRLRDYLKGTINIQIITVFNGRRIICGHDDTLETLIEQWEGQRGR